MKRTCQLCGTELHDDEKAYWRGCAAPIIAASEGFFSPSLDRDMTIQVHKDCAQITPPPRAVSRHQLHFTPRVADDPRVVVDGENVTAACTSVAFLPGRIAEVTVWPKASTGTREPEIGADGKVTTETLMCVYVVCPLEP